MGWTYELEMFHHRIGGRPLTNNELYQVELQYLQNDNTSVVLRIGLGYFELVDDDITTDLEHT